MKCFYCGKPTHIKRECKKFKREQFKGKCEEQKEDKDIAVVASDGDTIIVCDDACVNLACQDSTWVVDTVLSLHIIARRDFFSSYTSAVLVGLGWEMCRPSILSFQHMSLNSFLELHSSFLVAHCYSYYLPFFSHLGDFG